MKLNKTRKPIMASIHKEKIIKTPKIDKPHVVLLGAGASLAAFPKDDANKKKLPLMNNLVEIVQLTPLLRSNNINPNGDFENIYSTINDDVLKQQINKQIFDYFNSLKLPETVTIYDQLLLSLRQKDAIITFNWDPFLFDAYLRNKDAVLLPKIYFLHGNVRIGACENCGEWGMKSLICSRCNIKFKDVPLLYPIKKKRNFETCRCTAMHWRNAMCWFSHAFTITIFGYSAPTSDEEAVELLQKAWFKNSTRRFEYVEVIDILDHSELFNRWRKFTPTHHFRSHKRFEDSRLWRWPRRSCEQLYHAMCLGDICEDFPINAISDLNELHFAIKEISKYEQNNNPLK